MEMRVGSDEILNYFPHVEVDESRAIRAVSSNVRGVSSLALHTNRTRHPTG